MGPNDTVLEVNGCFSWGFTSNASAKKPEPKGAKKAVVAEESPKEEETGKMLSKFITLRDIKISVKKGEFITIIGDVGSGKSSLLQAIIGDLIYIPQNEIDAFGGLDHVAPQEDFDALKDRLVGGDFECAKKPIKVRGTVSYVEQGSWIQNKTIKDNILFNMPFDQRRYSQAIKTCQLERDLEILPAGDLTEIGEKGINLSGGQKARISLARAVYSDTDIIMMDDPISALDANVRKKIFKQVLVGLLKEKTRILVTHAIDFLHLSDKIIVIKEGHIQAFGTFQEL
jgi:ABC-type bacteriocin/lantibiotic exporter with double-glycine peptidase domain